jgi:hypothetical protein
MSELAKRAVFGNVHKFKLIPNIQAFFGGEGAFTGVLFSHLAFQHLAGVTL